MLTKLVFGLNSFVGGNNGTAANSVSGADSEEVLGVLLEATDTVFWSISTICCQGPGLTLYITSFHNVGDNLAATIGLRLIPGQADLTISGVYNSQVLDGSRDI